MSDEFRVDLAAGPEGSCLVTVSGEVDIVTGEELHHQLRLALHRASVVRLDLSGVTFFDCSGLRVLQAVRRQALSAGSGSRLVLRSVSPAVALCLRLSGLEAVFSVEPASATGDPKPPLPRSFAGSGDLLARSLALTVDDR